MNSRMTSSLIVVAGLFLLTQLSASMYYPAIPNFMDFFHVSEGQIMILTPCFFVSYAIGQLLWGILSDYTGRKKSYIVSLALYIISSIVLLRSYGFTHLLVGISLLGFSAAAFTSVGNAHLKAVFNKKVGKAISLVGIIMASGPLFSAFLAAQFILLYDWHLIFIFLMALAMIAFLVLLFCLDAPKEQKQSAHIKDTAKLSRKEISAMISAIALLGIAFGSMFVYLSSAPIIFMNNLGYTLKQFSFITLTINCLILFGAIVNFVGHYFFSSRTLQLIGLLFFVLGGSFFFLVHSISTYLFWLAVFAFGVGIIIPSSKAMIMASSRKSPGLTASIMKFSQTILCVIITYIASHIHLGSTLLSTQYLLFTLVIVAVVVYLFFILISSDLPRIRLTSFSKRQDF